MAVPSDPRHRRGPSHREDLLDGRLLCHDQEMNDEKGRPRDIGKLQKRKRMEQSKRNSRTGGVEEESAEDFDEKKGEAGEG